MAPHLKKWFVEHSLWDILKEVVKWVVGPSATAAAFAALQVIGNAPAYALASIQSFILVIFGLLLVVYRKQQTLKPAEVKESVTTCPLSLLDFRYARDNDEKVTYKLKIRAVLRNDFSKPIVIKQLKWHASSDEVSMQPAFAYRFQVEAALGSWKINSWEAEKLEIVVQPNWAFQFWIGISPNFQDADLRQRHEQGRVGTATVTLTVDNVTQDVDIEF